jgi:hypothetical protein
MVLAYLDPKGSSSYSNWELLTGYDVSPSSKCACAHHIQNLFKIRHIETLDMIVIGSSCVSKFSEESRIDVNRQIRRQKDPEGTVYCAFSECNKKVLQSVVNQFPDEDKIYHKACLEKVFHKCWTCMKYKKYNCDCIPLYRTCIEVGCNQEIKSLETWKTRCVSCYYKQKK